MILNYPMQTENNYKYRNANQTLENEIPIEKALDSERFVYQSPGFTSHDIHKTHRKCPIPYIKK